MSNDNIIPAEDSSTPSNETRQPDAPDQVRRALNDPAWNDDLEEARTLVQIRSLDGNQSERITSRAGRSDAGLSAAMIASIAAISVILSSSFDLSFRDVALVVGGLAALVFVRCGRRDFC
ncbi:hypothetical protein [Maritimibacter sp. UBA3975]|uniref:hypothetical protein n=1 Tax=Maritimibacter sp. UBA3975 TaxID=1946833 RepID=UPI000C0B8634|nr:hypothetical protein [Maritimibacter sp. UBA3975]MAM59866.1 hypothetical protein [Maritimibacter sp.]